MTVAAGVVTKIDRRPEGLDRYPTWEAVVVFTLISGDTTGVATIPINGLLQKIIAKLTDMEGAEGTTDIALSDNGDNIIWSVSDLAESATYKYSVNEPLRNEVNIALAFDDPTAAATVTVTLRGV